MSTYLSSTCDFVSKCNLVPAVTDLVSFCIDFVLTIIRNDFLITPCRIVWYSALIPSNTLCYILLFLQLRTGLYFFSAISEDVESQKLGIVMMLNHKLSAETVGKSIEELTRPEIRPEYTKFSTSVPVRYSAVHFCLDVPDDSSSMTAMHLALFSTMRALLISLLRHTARVRTRVHQGKGRGRHSRMRMMGNCESLDIMMDDME